MILNSYFLLSLAFKPSVEARKKSYLEKRISSLCLILRAVEKGELSQSAKLVTGGKYVRQFSSGSIEFNKDGWSISLRPLHPPYGPAFQLESSNMELKIN